VLEPIRAELRSINATLETHQQSQIDQLEAIIRASNERLKEAVEQEKDNAS
jgi:hypothetical protein